jgi:hypothetical protein
MWQHAAKYPNYKFQPQRRADKIRQREERERQRVEAKRLKEEAKSAASAGGGSRECGVGCFGFRG